MKYSVTVTMGVEVEVDESKFTEEFMAEFRQYFYPFDSVKDHAEHLAQLTARAIYPEIGEFNPDEFIEGYGPASEMGIKTRIVSVEEEVDAE